MLFSPDSLRHTAARRPQEVSAVVCVHNFIADGSYVFSPQHPDSAERFPRPCRGAVPGDQVADRLDNLMDEPPTRRAERRERLVAAQMFALRTVSTAASGRRARAASRSSTIVRAGVFSAEA